MAYIFTSIALAASTGLECPKLNRQVSDFRPMPPAIDHSPERYTFAIQVLKALALFGVFASLADFLNERYLTSAEDAAIVMIAAFVLYLARDPRHSKLPPGFSIGLLLYMCLAGTFTLLPIHLENTIWASIFPFTFFFLTGLRTGLWLSILCALTMPLSYFIFPYFNDAPEISLYSLLQVIGAFLLATVLAYKYEQVRTTQEIMLRHYSECDPLTGLLNRRGFATVSDNLLQQALRFRRTFAAVMIDLDDFKQVNDTQGHTAGDLLLQEVAGLLQRHTRGVDIIARWGGEEFILLLAQSDLKNASKVCEKIRSAIAEHTFTTGRHTASFGLAVHEQGESLEATINRADQAMYRAKFNGKNKVELLTLQPA